MSAAPIPHAAISRHAFRAQVCRLVERLINMLDDIDGDADLEGCGDDEPSLSASIPRTDSRSSQVHWLQGSEDEREEACEDEGAEHDGREPEDAL